LPEIDNNITGNTRCHIINGNLKLPKNIKNIYTIYTLYKKEVVNG
jgi:hypothetical protein